MQGIDYCHARRCISWPPEYRNASSPCAWWTKMAVSNIPRHGTICRCSRFLMNFLMNFLLGGSFTETWSQHPSGPCETAWLFRYSCCTTKTLHTFGETLWETVLYFRVFVPRFSYSATPCQLQPTSPEASKHSGGWPGMDETFRVLLQCHLCMMYVFFNRSEQCSCWRLLKIAG